MIAEQRWANLMVGLLLADYQIRWAGVATAQQLLPPPDV